METSSVAYQPYLIRMQNTSASRRDETLKSLKLYGPLLWLFRLFLRLTTGDKNPRVSNSDILHVPSLARNRRDRRSFGRLSTYNDMKVFRSRAMVSRMMTRGLTPRQYLEKKARLSPLGRVRIYGLRFWGTRLQRRAQHACCDNGSWHMPDCAYTRCGHWDAQLPDS